jgi:anti-sigma B factor antagonist
MLEIKLADDEKIVLSGRFDASQASKATEIFDSLTGSWTVDLKDLDYISSKGLAILLKTQKRLKTGPELGLRLVNVNAHINDIFHYSGFDQVFTIEPSPS